LIQLRGKIGTLPNDTRLSSRSMKSLPISFKAYRLIRAILLLNVGLSELVKHVSEKFQVEPEKVKRPNKTRHLSEARGVVCYLAVCQLGYRGAEVGKELHLGPTGVSIAVRRGEKSIVNYRDIESWVLANR